MTEVSIRTRARGHVYAECIAPSDTVDPLAQAGLAVDAVGALGDGLFEPLSVEVELACWDTETGIVLDEFEPAAPFHQLRPATLPDGVMIRGIWVSTSVTRCERLGRAEILDWLAAILAQEDRPRPDTTIGWTQCIVETVRARLPEASVTAIDGVTVPVAYGAGVIDYPVERSAGGVWVAGPLARNSDTAPFEVAIGNESGLLSIDWSLNWSPWIEADGAGRADVEAATARLLALGWDFSATVSG